MKIKKQKGSILVYTLIILSMMMAVVIGMTEVSISERRNASTTSGSVQAFQAADSGSQVVIRLINLNHVTPLSTVFSSCSVTTVGGVNVATTIGNVGSAEYSVAMFQGANGNTATDCSVTTDKITKVKSTGSFKETSRAVEIALAVGSSSLPVLYTTNYSSPTGQLNIFDVSDADVPVSVATAVAPVMTTPPYHMAVSGKFGYIADYTRNSVEILNLSNRKSPTKVSDFVTAFNRPIGVVATDSYLWVSNYIDSSVSVYAINSLTGALTNTGVTLSSASAPYGMAIYGNYLYLAVTSGRINVFDITNPLVATAPTTFNVGGIPAGLATSQDGNYLYVANPGLNEVEILDISVKDSPKQFAIPVKISGLSSPYGVAVYGTTVYVAKTGSNAIGVYDISVSPKNPIPKSDISVAGLNGPLGLALATGN